MLQGMWSVILLCILVSAVFQRFNCLFIIARVRLARFPNLHPVITTLPIIKKDITLIGVIKAPFKASN